MANGPTVLLFSQHLPSDSDPVAGVFVYDQAEALAAAGSHVIVGRLLAGASGIAETSHRGVQTLTVGHPRGRSALNYLLRGFAVSRLVTHLDRRGSKPDIIHVHWWRPALPIAVAGRCRRIPVVLTEHGSHWPRFTMSGRNLREGRLTMRLVDRALVVSEFLADVLREQGVSTPLIVVPNIVDRETFHSAPKPINDRRTVVTVARLNPPSKGIDLLIEACRASGGWQLVVIGDGVDRATYEAMAEGAPVRFAGQLTREWVAHYVRSADLFVSATPNSETFGVAAAEALSTGTPVVATNRGAMPEMVTPAVGILAEPSAPALAAAIEEALDRDWSSAAISAAAERFSAAAVAGQLLDIYRSLGAPY